MEITVKQLNQALTLSEDEVVKKLVEEASEVIQNAMKLSLYGKLTECEGVRYDNVKKLSEECGDFLNMLEMAKEHGLIDGEIVRQRWDEKRVSIYGFLKHTKANDEKYVIVENTEANDVSKYDFDDTAIGVHLSHSCHLSFTAYQMGIRPFYYNKDEAECFSQRLNDQNPSGRYKVCPVLKE